MLNLGLLKDDAMNFVAMVEAYYRVLVDDNVCLVEKPASKQSSDPDGEFPYFQEVKLYDNYHNHD